VIKKVGKYRGHVQEMPPPSNRGITGGDERVGYSVTASHKSTAKQWRFLSARATGTTCKDPTLSIGQSQPIEQI